MRLVISAVLDFGDAVVVLLLASSSVDDDDGGGYSYSSRQSVCEILFVFGLTLEKSNCVICSGDRYSTTASFDTLSCCCCSWMLLLIGLALTTPHLDAMRLSEPRRTIVGPSSSCASLPFIMEDVLSMIVCSNCCRLLSAVSSSSFSGSSLVSERLLTTCFTSTSRAPSLSYRVVPSV